MTEPRTPVVSVVQIIDTRRAAAELSLHALAAAVEVAEEHWGDIEVFLVDTTGAPDITALLDGIGGARIVDARGASRAEVVQRVLPELCGEVVWLGGTETCCHPSAIDEMVAAARRGGCLVLADSSDPAPYAALPSPLLVEVLGGSIGDHADVVPWLRDAVEGGGRAITVRGVGALRRSERTERAFGASTSVSPGTVSVGPATYSGPSTLLKNYGPLDLIEIGGYCSIADEVRIIHFGGQVYDSAGDPLELVVRGGHRMASPTTYPIGILVPDEPYDELPAGATGERLVVGDDVWVGYGARLLGAVTVGTGAVVGAGAVVVGDVPPYAVVAGVPARVLRFRFDETTRERLLRIRWWDWPVEVVLGCHRWLSGETPALLDHFDPAGTIGAGRA